MYILCVCVCMYVRFRLRTVHPRLQREGLSPFGNWNGSGCPMIYQRFSTWGQHGVCMRLAWGLHEVSTRSAWVCIPQGPQVRVFLCLVAICDLRIQKRASAAMKLLIALLSRCFLCCESYWSILDHALVWLAFYHRLLICFAAKVIYFVFFFRLFHMLQKRF